MTRINIPREPIDPVKIVRNQKVATEWKKRWFECWLCRRHNLARYDVHHIVGGDHRSDERCNYAYFCRDCHTFMENKMEPMSSVRLCVWLKTLYDIENLNVLRIEALFGRRI